MKAIYAIRCKPNGKMYIGKTSAGRIRSRINEHLSMLESNHHNYSFQRDFNKYGRDAFEYYILDTYEECEEPDFKRIKEYEWMKIYKSTDKDFGYNTDDKAAIAYLKQDANLIPFMEGLPPIPGGE